uniref:Uncharacterized protein n=2 Tax=Oryza sativa subsp. japonica TaxID=39947 RepID=Q10EJ3_ORYSJ|nr:hypothetical protein [Oryza sativa Japonica Group]ABF98380.1 hypothetical protein LOC_Os03g49240 [Oryza sativa Japonica Group]
MSKIPNSFTVRVASAGLQVVAAATRGQRAAGRRSGAGQRAAESGAGREVRRRQRRGWRARREVRRSRGCTRRDGLWRRRDEDDGEEEDIAVDERDSLGLPLPVVSNCSSSECEYMAESEAELAKTEEKCASASSASEYEKTSQSSTGSVAFHGAADAGGDGHKGNAANQQSGGLDEPLSYCNIHAHA